MPNKWLIVERRKPPYYWGVHDGGAPGWTLRWDKAIQYDTEQAATAVITWNNLSAAFATNGDDWVKA